MFYKKSKGERIFPKKMNIKKKQRDVMKSKFESLTHSEKKNRELSEDTENRIKIQKFISESIKSGYKREDIIAVLRKKCPDKEEFFEIWINNWMNKLVGETEKMIREDV